MKVMILKSDKRLGVKAGEVYQAERYKYDPTSKVSLLAREPDGYCPECNQYLDEVAHFIGNRWRVIEDNTYVVMDKKLFHWLMERTEMVLTNSEEEAGQVSKARLAPKEGK